MADTKGAVDAKLAEDKRKAELAARLRGAASIPAVGSGGPSDAAVIADVMEANYRAAYDEALEMAYMQLAYRIQAGGDLSKVSKVIEPKDLAEEIAKLKQQITVSGSQGSRSLLIPTFVFNPQDKGLTIFALAELLKTNEPIDFLVVSCKLTDDEIVALTQALRVNNTVKNLIFSGHHNLGDVGCFLLAQALRGNRSITTLDINCLAKFIQAHNDTIGDLSAMAFANALAADAKTVLEHLRLRACKISEYGVAILGRLLHTGSKLKSLDLSDNNIDPNAQVLKYLDPHLKASDRHLFINGCTRESSPYSLTEDTRYEFVRRSFIGTPVSKLAQMNGAEAHTCSDAGAAAAAAASAPSSGAAVTPIIHAMQMHANVARAVAAATAAPAPVPVGSAAAAVGAQSTPTPVPAPVVSPPAEAPKPKGPKG